MIKHIYSMLAVSSLSLPLMAVGAQPYQTYVIDTYGGADLLPAVRQQLSGTGSSASVYQDKLVLRTTLQGYEAVQQLLRQIDGAPQALTVSVRVGRQANSTSRIQQSRVIITSDGERVNVGGYGRFGEQAQSQQGSSLYQVQTLSGKPASIQTSTLLSLSAPVAATTYNRWGQVTGSIWIQGRQLATAAQGIKVTPKVLPNGQVQVDVSQIEDQVTTSARAPIDSQRLTTLLAVPRGQWVTIGQIEQSNDHTSRSSSSSQQRSYPIELMVQ